eukprot:2793614-Pyramimonas_sp.AAC.1
MRGRSNESSSKTETDLLGESVESDNTLGCVRVNLAHPSFPLGDPIGLGIRKAKQFRESKCAVSILAHMALNLN